MSDDFIVVQSYPQMISYIDHLQHKNAESLAFYPICVFERELEKGRLFLGLLNGEPCGYIYIGAPPDLKCHQVCIQYDARRRLYGASLVMVMEEYASQHHCNSITLRCGFDLDANVFWDSLGYKCIGNVDGGIRRNRKINLWRKQLQPLLFEDVIQKPVFGKTSATYWNKHKQTGIVTQFHRGKTLKDYRAIILKEESNHD